MTENSQKIVAIARSLAISVVVVIGLFGFGQFSLMTQVAEAQSVTPTSIASTPTLTPAPHAASPPPSPFITAGPQPEATPQTPGGNTVAQRDWMDWTDLGLKAVGGVLALGGLAGVALNIWWSRREQRIASGPFIRVDISGVGDTDFAPPRPHYSNENEVIDLTLPGEGPVSIWTWISNVQPHPLGFAVGVTAHLLLEMARADGKLVLEIAEVKVAYVQWKRPVRIEVFRIPRSSIASVRLVSLVFYDLYQRRHEHAVGGDSRNGIYGRFLCDYSNDRCVSTPEAWPQGRRIEPF